MPKYFDQVDFSENVRVIFSTPSYVSGDFSYKRVITNTATLKSSGGFVERVILGNIAPTTLRIFDTTTILSTTLGRMINTVTKISFATAPASFDIGVKLTKGIRVILSTPSDLTFSFR